MRKSESQAKIELKAVILAGGTKAAPGDRPMVLQRLGERTILDYVLANARQVVSADDLYVVVGERQDEVRAQLGDQCHYVVQPEPLGTGHAVQQLAPEPQGLSGQPVDPLRRYAPVPTGVHPRAAEPACVAAGAPDTPHRDLRPSAALWAHHPRCRRGASWISSRRRRRRPRCGKSTS